MPLWRMMGAAAGAMRPAISARAASGSRALAAIPAANTVKVLQLGRQRADEVDAGNGQQLAHLLEADQH